MSTKDEEISQKLNVLIALSLKRLTFEQDGKNGGKRKSHIGEHARFLADMGISAKDISRILGAPITSIRTLITPGRRK